MLAVEGESSHIADIVLDAEPWEDGWSGRALGTTMVTAFGATDTEGPEWFRDWDGRKGDGPGDWQTSDGAKAAVVYLRHPTATAESGS